MVYTTLIDIYMYIIVQEHCVYICILYVIYICMFHVHKKIFLYANEHIINRAWSTFLARVGAEKFPTFA